MVHSSSGHRSQDCGSKKRGDRRFIRVSHTVAGPTTCAVSCCFPRPQQGGGLEREPQRCEPVLTQDVGSTGGGFTCYATTLAPAHNFQSPLYCSQSSCFYCQLVVVLHLFSSFINKGMQLKTAPVPPQLMVLTHHRRHRGLPCAGLLAEYQAQGQPEPGSGLQKAAGCSGRVPCALCQALTVGMNPSLLRQPPGSVNTGQDMLSPVGR